MHKNRFLWIVVVASLAGACSSNVLDDPTARSAATGAAVGAGAAVLTDGDPVQGAVVGGTLGGLFSWLRRH